MGCVPNLSATWEVTVCVTSTYVPVVFCPLQREALNTLANTTTKKANSTAGARVVDAILIVTALSSASLPLRREAVSRELTVLARGESK